MASTFPDWMAGPGWGGAFATEGQQYTANAEGRVDLTLRISYVYIGPERLTPGSVFGVIQMQIAPQ
ncbi:MAG: hypothetical protein MO847_09245 [Candidatus Protistobacter heckmanni]|nr:hypothetical protein [Candidatus Protistobacter heckmanni]